MLKYIIPFLLIGCHPSIDLHSDVAIDSTFTQEQLTDIITATEQWKNTTGGMVDLDLIITNTPEEYGNDTMKILYSDDATVNPTNTLFGHTEFVASINSITLYPNRISQSSFPFKEIILHELGHALGLHHASQGLMTPVPTGINCIDNATLDQFCGLHNCGNAVIKTDCE